MRQVSKISDKCQQKLASYQIMKCSHDMVTSVKDKVTFVDDKVISLHDMMTSLKILPILNWNIDWTNLISKLCLPFFYIPSLNMKIYSFNELIQYEIISYL